MLRRPSQASHTHDAIAEAAQLMKEAVDDIMVTLNEAASEVGMVGGMVESIAEAMAKVGTERWFGMLCFTVECNDQTTLLTCPYCCGNES